MTGAPGLLPSAAGPGRVVGGGAAGGPGGRRGGGSGPRSAPPGRHFLPGPALAGGAGGGRGCFSPSWISTSPEEDDI